MLKKLMAITLALVLVLGMVGCNKKNDPGSGSGSSESESDSTPATPQLKEGATLQDIVDDVNAEFPISMPDAMSDQLMTDLLELDLSSIEEYAGAMGMSITTADNFIVIKANDGKVTEVEDALYARLEYVRKSFEQYLPIPREKANAGEVLTIGNYVFLIIMGSNDMEDFETYDFAADVELVEEKILSYFDMNGQEPQRRK